MQPRFLAVFARIASAILITTAIALAVVSLLLVRRDWALLRDGVASPHDLLFWAAPIALAAILIAGLRIRPVLRIQLVLVGLSIAAASYGVELFLDVANARAARYLLPIEARMSSDARMAARVFAKRFGVDYDTRTGLEFITDLRSRDPQVVSMFGPAWFLRSDGGGGLKSMLSIDGVELQPLGGIAQKLTVQCNESGSWVTFPSDEHGFRNPPGLWGAGALDIAGVGDSFTHGVCVPPGKDFVALIREQYPRTLNLGMSGHGPLLELGLIKEYLPALKPKIVLWFYYEGNDLSDLKTEKQSALLRRYLEDGFTQHLLDRQADIDRVLTEDMRAAEIAALARLSSQVQETHDFRDLILTMKLTALRTRLSLLRDDFVDPESPDYGLFRDVLSHADATVHSWGGTLYFVYLPGWASFATPPYPTEVFIHPETDRRWRSEVLAIVDDLHLPLIDLYPAFRADRDPLDLFPFHRMGHYNENGHRFVANAVLKALSAAFPGQTRDSVPRQTHEDE